MQLQTQQVVSKGVVGMAVQVVRNHGVLALYNGLTASVGRQVCQPHMSLPDPEGLYLNSEGMINNSMKDH